MSAGDATARRALDKETSDRFASVSIAGAGWKLEDLARVERVRNAQRLISWNTRDGRELLLRNYVRARCARRFRRSDLAVQSVARCDRSERQRKRNGYIA